MSSWSSWVEELQPVSSVTLRTLLSLALPQLDDGTEVIVGWRNHVFGHCKTPSRYLCLFWSSNLEGCFVVAPVVCGHAAVSQHKQTRLLRPPHLPAHANWMQNMYTDTHEACVLVYTFSREASYTLRHQEVHGVEQGQKQCDGRGLGCKSMMT